MADIWTVSVLCKIAMWTAVPRIRISSTVLDRGIESPNQKEGGAGNGLPIPLIGFYPALTPTGLAVAWPRRPFDRGRNQCMHYACFL